MKIIYFYFYIYTPYLKLLSIIFSEQFWFWL